MGVLPPVLRPAGGERRGAPRRGDPGWAETRPRHRRGSPRRPMRERVKLAGVVRRITVFPVEGHERSRPCSPTGPASAVVVFMGRRGIPGLTLGTRVVVEGVLGEKRGQRPHGEPAVRVHRRSRSRPSPAGVRAERPPVPDARLGHDDRGARGSRSIFFRSWLTKTRSTSTSLRVARAPDVLEQPRWVRSFPGWPANASSSAHSVFVSRTPSPSRMTRRSSRSISSPSLSGTWAPPARSGPPPGGAARGRARAARRCRTASSGSRRPPGRAPPPCPTRPRGPRGR